VSTSTSTTVPECNTLRVRSARLVRARGNRNQGRLVIHGVLAKRGWENVNPMRSGIALSGNRVGGSPLFCCTTSGAAWTSKGKRSYVLADPERSGCPLEEMKVVIRRNGRATFTAKVPQVDLAPGAERSVSVTVLAGDECSGGDVPLQPVSPTPPPASPSHECN
jgi:hypothetical protein